MRKRLAVLVAIGLTCVIFEVVLLLHKQFLDARRALSDAAHELARVTVECQLTPLYPLNKAVPDRRFFWTHLFSSQYEYFVQEYGQWYEIAMAGSGLSVDGEPLK